MPVNVGNASQRLPQVQKLLRVPGVDAGELGAGTEVRHVVMTLGRAGPGVHDRRTRKRPLQRSDARHVALESQREQIHVQLAGCGEVGFVQRIADIRDGWHRAAAGGGRHRGRIESQLQFADRRQVRLELLAIAGAELRRKAGVVVLHEVERALLLGQRSLDHRRSALRAVAENPLVHSRRILLGRHRLVRARVDHAAERPYANVGCVDHAELQRRELGGAAKLFGDVLIERNATCVAAGQRARKCRRRIEHVGNTREHLRQADRMQVAERVLDVLRHAFAVDARHHQQLLA